MSSEPMTPHGDFELPPKPAAPEPGDCCGGGCARCVFDLYDEELARWERQVAEIVKQREQAREKDRHP